MSHLSIAALLCLLASPATAADCGLADLAATGTQPEAFRVTGPDPLTLHASQLRVEGCPQAGAACQPQDYVLQPGAAVVVTSMQGDALCASMVGDAPSYPLISGLVPKAALQPAGVADPAWTGSWRYSIEQQIVMRALPDGKLEVEGAATYGMFDPLRVARRTVTEGSFVAEVRPRRGQIAFTRDDKGHTLPYDPAATTCSVRLWQLGQYLAVVDNSACGGAGVTFTGLYRHGSWAD